ncbi:MAG: hypothetical protein WA957_10295 [Alteraurantiacibacter sp.]
MLALFASLTALASQPAQSECSYDREEELSRDVVSFDQTEGRGWRPLYDAGCYIEAAELLRDWQLEHGEDFDLANPRDRSLARILVWHEAQMWAFGERTELAVPIFEETYSEEESAGAWNLYVDGTLAFLSRDKLGLETAIKKLAAIPKPPGWDSAVGADGQPISLPWPQNLDVLQALSRCWDQAYSVAYVCRNIPELR